MRVRFVSCVVAVLFAVQTAPAAPLRFEFSAADANRLQFAPVKAKFVKMALEGGGNGSSAIDELEVYGPDAKDVNLAAATLGSKASASGCIAGYAAHRVEHLNDGVYGNDRSWVTPESDSKSFVCIELPEITLVDTVVFSRDQLGDFTDRLPQTVSLEVSEDGEQFQSIGDVTFVRKPSRFVTWAKLAIPPNVPPPPPIALLPRSQKTTTVDQKVFESEWRTTLVDEEYAWLKTFGYADIDPSLTHTPYPAQHHPVKIPNDETTLVHIAGSPKLDGVLDEPLWQRVSDATVRVASPGTWEEGANVETHVRTFRSDDNLYLAITTNRLLSAHIAILQTADTSGVVALTDSGKLVWRQYRAGTNEVVTEQPLAGTCANNGAGYCAEFAVPLTLLPLCERGVTVRAGIGGRYTPAAGHAVRFYPSDVAVVAHDAKSRDSFAVTFVNHANAPRRIILDNETPIDIPAGENVNHQVAATRGEIGPEQTLRFTIAEQNLSGVRYLFQYDPVARTLNLFEAMIDRAARDATTPEEKSHAKHGADMLAALREEAQSVTSRHARVLGGHPEKADQADAIASFAQANPTASVLGPRRVRGGDGTVRGGDGMVRGGDGMVRGGDEELFLRARRAKREFFFADTSLQPLEQILFEKRYPLHPSHNYSDYYDSTWRAGGGIYTLRIPCVDGVLTPERAEVTELFATTGMARHPVANFDVSKIYFTNRASNPDYWHIMEMNPDGSDVRQLTDGPFQDLWPCPLPDGGLAFISTRCRQKFLCWEPQASVLYRMNKDGGDITRLSFANLTEFAPSVARDGRILWTRSEYLDKGADYGHTLWQIRPDGVMPELTFGNTIVLPQGYANGRELPGTNEILAVMISHFGDLNGPVAILDIDKGRLNSGAITSITPEVPWPGYWARCETFREPFPITRDVFLVSHSSRDRFALFVIDRYGNRELLSIDPSLSSMCPTPLRVTSPPLQLSSGIDSELATRHEGVFTVEDVYQGIDHIVPRGSAKYIRVSQEMPHFLEKFSDGTYRASYQPFMEFYASPVDLVSGPYGWTSYVAKGDLGLVEIEKDGSVSFVAPSEKVLFFQLLDKDYNEIQRMRSVVQLQPGESRSCIGCHEDRTMLSTRRQTIAAQKSPKTLTPSPWGTGALDYQKVVQPVWDQHCVSCHDGSDTKAGRIDLTGKLDGDYIPASFKTVIRGGYVHHFNWGYQAGVPTKAEPYSFGTFQTRLWTILGDENHKQIVLPEDASRAIKCWTDLSCPLWPDYKQRRLRGDASVHDGTSTEP
ncbi:MAG: hypothetical protein ACRC46_01015 [Thermoguttaceae bacterium]